MPLQVCNLRFCGDFRYFLPYKYRARGRSARASGRALSDRFRVRDPHSRTDLTMNVLSLSSQCGRYQE